MNVTVKGQVGKSVYEVSSEGRDVLEAFANTAFIGEDQTCKLCKNTDISLNVTKTTSKTSGDTFIYVKRYCPKCRATSVLGQYKGGGYFWRKWEIWENPNFPKEPQSTLPASYSNPGPSIRKVEKKNDETDFETLDDVQKDLPF